MGHPPVSASQPLRANRQFHVVFWAQGCTDYCDQLLVVALTWGALHRLGGASLGLVLASWTVPRGVVLLFSGVFIDRWDRRSVAVGVSAALGLLSLAGALVTRSGDLAAWMGLAAVIGVFDAFRMPVGASVLPMVVAEEHLVDANRWSSLREWSALTAGPAVAGVLVALVSVTGAFVTAAALYLASCVIMLFAPRLRPVAAGEGEPGEKRGVLSELRGGYRMVLSHPVLRVLLPAFALANLFVLGLIGVAIPVLVKDVLHAGPTGLGFLSGSYGAGLVAGTFLCNRLPAAWRDSPAKVCAMFAVSDGLLACVGLSPVLAGCCVLYFLSGLLSGPPATYYRTMLQTLPPPEYLGRVNSLARATTFGLEPVSTAGIGALSARISAAVLLVVGGGAAVCVDLGAALISRRSAARLALAGDAAPGGAPAEESPAAPRL